MKQRERFWDMVAQRYLETTLSLYLSELQAKAANPKRKFHTIKILKDNVHCIVEGLAFRRFSIYCIFYPCTVIRFQTLFLYYFSLNSFANIVNFVGGPHEK